MQIKNAVIAAVATIVLATAGVASASPWGHFGSSVTQGGSGFSTSNSTSNSVGQSFGGVTTLPGGGFMASMGSEQGSTTMGGSASGAGISSKTTGLSSDPAIAGNLNASSATSTTQGATGAHMGGGAGTSFGGFGGSMFSEDSSSASNTSDSVAGAATVNLPTMTMPSIGNMGMGR